MSMRGWLGALVFVALALLGPAAPPPDPSHQDEHSILWFEGITAAPQLRAYLEPPAVRAPQQPNGQASGRQVTQALDLSP